MQDNLEIKDKKKSIVWVILWVLSFSSAMTLSKNLDSNIPTILLLLIRSSFATITILPLLLKGSFF